MNYLFSLACHIRHHVNSTLALPLSHVSDGPLGQSCDRGQVKLGDVVLLEPQAPGEALLEDAVLRVQRVMLT